MKIRRPLARSSFAAAVQEKDRISGQKVAVVASGGNVDREVFAAVLASSKETS